MTTPVILDEDTYTEAISLIIERDFFPNLAKIRAQQNYLEAQQSGSFVDLQEASSRLHNIVNNKKKDKVRDLNLPLNYYIEQEPDIHKRVNLELSLDQFQTLYTSEDNASFTDLLEKANIKIKQQNKWFFDRESKQLRITDRPDEESPIRLIEPSSVMGWKYKARNALMYFPEGKSESWIKPEEARGLPKSIEYNNTSLELSTTIPNTKHNNLAPTDKAALEGKMTPWSQIKGMSDECTFYSPQVRGYGLVDSTPTLSPSRIGTPQMTWGSIEGTPLLVSGSQTPGPHYTLPKISRREELGMKLSEKASKAYRKKTVDRKRNIHGTPRTGAGLLSPAAQHLFRKSTSTTPKINFGQALRDSYGGSSMHSPRSTKRPGQTPTPLFRAGATPNNTLFKKKEN